MGVQWQKQPGKKWLAELLANIYVIEPLLEFLKNTKVKRRESTVEKIVK